jgi:outer membrane biosynthesis protein TonB
MAKQDDTEPENESLAVNDAWTGMLVVSFLTLSIGAGFLFWDWYQYTDPPKVTSFSTAPPGAIKPPSKEPPKEAPKEDAKADDKKKDEPKADDKKKDDEKKEEPKADDKKKDDARLAPDRSLTVAAMMFKDEPSAIIACHTCTSPWMSAAIPGGTILFRGRFYDGSAGCPGDERRRG